MTSSAVRTDAPLHEDSTSSLHLPASIHWPISRIDNCQASPSSPGSTSIVLSPSETEWPAKWKMS